ncbi:unnamed protein product [Amoebophrya sp. A120]|nr:unnamed protein product [Amoebophrya sp. A120]|eukprot:GSA120T00004533001.1
MCGTTGGIATVVSVVVSLLSASRMFYVRIFWCTSSLSLRVGCTMKKVRSGSRRSTFAIKRPVTSSSRPATTSGRDTSPLPKEQQ